MHDYVLLAIQLLDVSKCLHSNVKFDANYFA